MKATPERNCMYEIGINFCIIEPARTPSKEDRTRAQAEPIKIYQIELDLEANIIVESCVLSPNSATKTNKKAEIMDFHIKCLPN